MTATTGPLDRVYTREEAEAMRARSEVMPADAVGETVLTFFTAALGDARRILRGPVDWKGFDALMAFRNASIDHYAQKTKDDWKRLGQPVECARGCTRCCQQHVLASFSECFAAVRALRAAGFTGFASVEAQATLAATMSHEARWAGKVSCAMLNSATNLCRVYKARPGICRAYMSLSKHHCYFETTAPTPEQNSVHDDGDHLRHRCGAHGARPRNGASRADGRRRRGGKAGPRFCVDHAARRGLRRSGVAHRLRADAAEPDGGDGGMSEKEKGRTALDRAWDEAERHPGEGIPIGRTVVCDICDADYTDSAESGGFIYKDEVQLRIEGGKGDLTHKTVFIGDYAVCPRCSADALKTFIAHGEEHHIRARCPPDQSFADFVRADRGPDAFIRVDTEKTHKGD